VPEVTAIVTEGVTVADNPIVIDAHPVVVPEHIPVPFLRTQYVVADVGDAIYVEPV
jgi:hypothetical protein